MARIREAGFEVSSQKESHLTKEMAESFYGEHADKDFFDQLVEFMSRRVILHIKFKKWQKNLFITRPKCALCELWADSAARTLPLIFFCSFIFFDHSDKILTYLKTCLWNPDTCRHKILRLYSAQFRFVMFEVR